MWGRCAVGGGFSAVQSLLMQHVKGFSHDAYCSFSLYHIPSISFKYSREKKNMHSVLMLEESGWLKHRLLTLETQSTSHRDRFWRLRDQTEGDVKNEPSWSLKFESWGPLQTHYLLHPCHTFCILRLRHAD